MLGHGIGIGGRGDQYLNAARGGGRDVHTVNARAILGQNLEGGRRGRQHLFGERSVAAQYRGHIGSGAVGLDKRSFIHRIVHEDQVQSGIAQNVLGRFSPV